MVGNEPTPSFEQFCPLFIVNAQVVGQALPGFLDVSSSLVQGQRKAIHCSHDVESCCTIGHRGTAEGGIVSDDACSSEEEFSTLFCLHRVELDLASEAPHRLGPGGQQ